MQKIDFKNYPNTTTPINATNLNLIQDNIESAIDTVENDIPTIENSLNSDSTTNGASVHAVNEKIDEITTYSTSEIKIGTWMGKPLYRKIIECGNLPNDTYKEINTNINNGNIVRYDGYAKNSSLNVIITIDQFQSNSSGIRASIYPNKIRITSIGDWSSWDGYVIIEYTKTTD